MSAGTRPVPAAVRPYQFPEVHHATLPNGLRLVVAPMHRLPIVTALALVDVGAASDPADRDGLVALTARTLDEGTGALDGAELTARFEGMGTAFEAGADWDSTLARVTVTPARLDAAFALFADVLRAPSFPDEDVDRKREERLEDLAQQVAEPRGLADMRFTSALYGGARYGSPAGGSPRSVGGLGATDVRACHARHYGPATTTLILVGDISVDVALRLAEARFGDWRTEATEGVTRAATPSVERQRTVVVAKADAPQSELRIGHVGLPRRHPDHLAVVVMNAILGGLFSSRINLNLRERHAFTYGASSGFDWRRGAGPFVVSTAVKTDVTDRAVQEILREIDAMRAAPPTGDELSLAVDYLAGVFPLRFESTSAVAGAIAGAVVHALPEDWFRSYRDRVRAVSAADVHRVAQAHLDPARLLVLAVGDAAAIEAPLAALAHGTMQVVPATHDFAEPQ
ncbi:MAG: insulinase family protein [Gemmatimonadaceae bacterium]|nr:insulinase family protein [Gemmatimonadaceae bacterium]MCW5826959.1 insulinase family protein [Gemmatimonadaceae bacterium]